MDKNQQKQWQQMQEAEWYSWEASKPSHRLSHSNDRARAHQGEEALVASQSVLSARLDVPP